jgi:DNA-binding MarR family transcriptional regulator
MSYNRQPYHKWTVEEAEKIIDLWDTNSNREIADILGLEEGRVSAMAYVLRKNGIVLSRKSRNGSVQRIVTEIRKKRGLI